MKKILLSVTLACFAFVMNGSAQILSQDFESVTMPALPTGWTLGGSTGSPSWYTSATAGSTWYSLTDYYNLPAHTQYVVVDDNAYPTQLHDTLMSPVFSLAGTTSAWLNFDCFFYGATNTSEGLTEQAYVLGSTDGGATWAVIDSVLPEGWGGAWVTQHTSLASLGTSTTCKIAYTYADNAGKIIGCALDNIQVVNLTASDAAVTAVNYNSIVNGVSINGENLSFTIQNNGIPITSLNMYYTMNGGTYVSETFTPTGFASYTSQTFTFSTAMAGAITGSNAIHVGINTVNGVATPDIDSTKNSSFILASSSVQRAGLIEEFSSSTCNPCMYFNAGFDPLCNSLNVDVPGSNFNMLKYQMNWPDDDDDRSYNNDGSLRRTYYSCNSIPDHWVNGVHNTVGNSLPLSSTDITNYTAQINGASANKAFMDMSAAYVVDTNSKTLSVTVTVTPHFTMTGSYHLYVGVADKHYQNIDNEWGQLDYYNVERKMFPNGNGTAITSLTDGVPFTYTDSNVNFAYTDWTLATTTAADSSLYPKQLSNTFWASPLTNSELIAFVEEDGPKSVMQSIVAPVTNGSTTGVSTLSKVSGIKIYPNPAKDAATLSFSLGTSGNVEINVMEYNGRMVSNVMNQNMAAGNQNVTIPTANIVPGNYIVIIKTATGTNAERLTVEK